MKNVKHTVLSFLGIVALSMMLTSCYSLWDDLSSITVSFDSNSGTGKMEPQKFVAGVSQAIKENTFTKEGYTFAGWALSADAATAEYADKANFTATKDTTLYAIWNIIPPVPSKVRITYVSDRGTLPETKEVEAGYTLTAEDLEDLTADGYNFKGWDKAVGDVISSDTKITASWKKLVTITYSSAYGTKPENSTVEEGYTLTAADLKALTAEGYNFKGWDKSVGDVISSNTTITASWKKTWEITYSLPSGYSKEPKVVEEGYKLTAEDLPNIETNDTYYMLNQNVGYEITANTQISGDWDGIVYLKKLTSISEISSKKSKIEKIVFTSDTYSGAATTIDCADNSTNPAIPTDYFKGVLTDGTVSGQYILTVYGNGHRIYAPENCTQLFSNYSVLTTIEFSNFYTSKTTNMSAMFYNSNALTSLNVSGFITSEVTNMMAMFWNCSKLTSLDVSNFDTSKVTTMQNMFNGLTVTKLDLSNFVTTSVNNMSGMFQNCTNLTTLNISSFNTSAVTNMSNMFYGCSSLTSLDVSKFVTTNVTNMSTLFSGCSSLKTIDLSSWNTEKVTNMSSMFRECKELTTLKISSLNTSEVSDMGYMFDTCEKLESLDLSHFNTSKVTTMVNMFNQCKSLKSINVSSFNTSKVTNMGHMFNRCEKLTSIEVSNFNTSDVSSMRCMFQECISLISLDLSSFVNSNLVDIDTMFSKCTELVTIYVSSGFELSNISTQAVDLLFSGDSKLVGSEGSACNGSTGIDRSYAHIDGGTGNPGYFTSK